MRAPLLILFGLALTACAADRLTLFRPLQYNGMADASGAVAVSSNLFVAADDEENVLCLYRNDRGSAPLREFDLNPFLGTLGKHAEADLEAGTRLGQRAFWIGSHGRSREGESRPNRCVLFVTEISGQGEAVRLLPIGRPYRRLLEDFENDAQLKRFHLAEAASRAPKDPGALNIEGLSATPEGHLLIGFRNPIPDEKALLVPLMNPDEVIAGSRAHLGEPLLLELGGLGIRDIALWQQTYIIIAGAFHGGGPFHIYRWAGPGKQPERLRVQGLKPYHPEALVIYPELGLEQFQVLSDDGKDAQDNVPNRELPKEQKSFRSFWLRP